MDSKWWYYDMHDTMRGSQNFTVINSHFLSFPVYAMSDLDEFALKFYRCADEKITN